MILNIAAISLLIVWSVNHPVKSVRDEVDHDMSVLEE
jgi:hypothetical protein